MSEHSHRSHRGGHDGHRRGGGHRGRGRGGGERDFSDHPSHRGRRGGGRGRGGGPPAGLRGREIGMFYAKKSRDKQAKNRTAAHIPEEELARLERDLARFEGQLDQLDNDSDLLNELQRNIDGNALKDRTYIGGYRDGHGVPPSPSSASSPRPTDDEDDIFISKRFRRNASLDRQLREHEEEVGEGGKLTSFRRKLPSYKKRQQILESLGSSQVLVVSGETGCGKTTQVPQFLLEDCLNREEGSTCRIVVTQPRRISAISVADRVAEERGEPLGKSVGYQIRLESKLPRDQGSILFCTTGIVLQWLRSSPLLEGISHLILDEVHERDTLSDFLITIARDILPHRPDFRLILMSATLDAHKFSKYFGNCPTVEIPGFTFPVEEFYLEDVLEMTKFRLDKQNAKDNSRKTYRHSNEENDFEMKMGPFLRDIESSYSKSTMDILWRPESEKLNIDLVAALVQHIHSREEEGAILVFLPGWTDISKLSRLLTQSSSAYFLRGSVAIHPLHSLMPTTSQRDIFLRPPRGTRKIVIATNIAETSITIDDIVYVVDCGKIKIKNFDLYSNLATIQAEWVSLANAKQRRGRAGRVQPGKCYHLFTKGRKHLLESYLQPEICRSRMEEVILQVKLLQLGSCSRFLERMLDPPSGRALKLSLEFLETINAVRIKPNTNSEELTPLGFHLAHLPLDPQTGKMILLGAIFSCLDPVLSVAASLGFKDAFQVPLGKERMVDARKKEIAGSSRSDHLMLANVLIDYENATNRSQYCWNNFLSESVIKMLLNMKNQLAEHLYRRHFLRSPNVMDKHANMNSNHEGLVRAIICAGLYPNVAKVKKVKRMPHENNLLMSVSDRRLLFHPKSVLVDEQEFTYPWVVYHLKMKSAQAYLHDATVVSPLSLLFFGQYVKTGVETLNDGTRLETVSADNYVTFNCEKRTSEIVKRARKALEEILREKVSNPCFTDWSGPNGRVLRTIVSLLETELQGAEPDYED